jgi:hypothetical protein
MAGGGGAFEGAFKDVCADAFVDAFVGAFDPFGAPFDDGEGFAAGRLPPVAPGTTFASVPQRLSEKT